MIAGSDKGTGIEASIPQIQKFVEKICKVLKNDLDVELRG